ncbi:MAG: hypothetical protein IJQ79_03230 [Bacteroidales bacterium]|nr:hypothetical protein [Bacteroidales bacterium]
MGVKVEGIDSAMAFIEREAKKRVRDYLAVLNRIGLDVVRKIRNGTASYWIDQTGNLRNSIGFIVMEDGRVVNRNFASTVPGGTLGTKAGESFAEELASKYPKGYCLIIVAGMDYAAYVEAVESRSVLAGGELVAHRLHKELTAKLEARWRSK